LERELGFEISSANCHRTSRTNLSETSRADVTPLPDLERVEAHAMLPPFDSQRQCAGLMIDACTLAQVVARFVRRETDLDPRLVLGTTTD
jgi:hypothetical protein